MHSWAPGIYLIHLKHSLSSYSDNWFLKILPITTPLTHSICAFNHKTINASTNTPQKRKSIKSHKIRAHWKTIYRDSLSICLILTAPMSYHQTVNDKKKTKSNFLISIRCGALPSISTKEWTRKKNLID